VVVSVRDLTVQYKQLLAVHNVSFDVAQGEIFGIIGPNGAGKTSTIECIEGLRKSAGGEIQVMGIDPAQRSQLYQLIGVQLQEAFYPDAIKVDELCRLFSSFYSAPLDYRQLLERFDLKDKEKAYVSRLSGGQRQKLSIIVALLGNPKVLFLDELTTGLDPQSRVNMWDLIKSLRDEGKTIVMTTHYMDEAEYLCDRVCLMVKGEIAAIGTVKDLVEQAGQSQKITFTTSAEIEELKKLPEVGKVSVAGNRVEIHGLGQNLLRDVVVWLTDHKVDFDGLSYDKPGLEAVFFKYTGFRMGEEQ